MGGTQRRHAMLGVRQVDGRVPRATPGAGRDETPTEVPSAREATARQRSRVGAYLALMDDRYPSTDEEQAVHLDFPYPDAPRELHRWLPLVKWFLAIPHYIILAFLSLAVVVVVIVAWFAILFGGRYPRGLFGFVEGVFRWTNRVAGYAAVLITDRYPPFRLAP